MIQLRFTTNALGVLIALLLPSVTPTAHAANDPTPAAAREQAAARTTYYFSTSGRDENDGLSAASPKRSLGLIPSLLRSGTVVLLKRGDVWSEPGLSWDFSDKSGTAAAPLRVGSYGDASWPLPVVVIAPDGDRTAARVHVIHARNTHYLTIENLELRGGPDWRAALIEPPNSDIVFDNVQLSRAGKSKASTGPLRTTTSGVTYFFSDTGSSQNDGLAPDRPRLSVREVPSLVSAGDTVLLERGSIWYNPPPFAWDFSGMSGTAASPMRIGAYGDPSRPRPVVCDMVKDSTSAWTPEGNDVYSIAEYGNPTPTDDRVLRLYLGGQPIPKDSTLAILTDNTYCVANGRIYVKSSTFLTYPYVETNQNGGDFKFVYGKDVQHLVLEDLELRGGDTNTAILFHAPTRDITVRNVYVHQIYGSGIGVSVFPTSDLTVKNTGIKILDCTVDRGWTSAMNYEYAHKVGPNGFDEGPAGGQFFCDGVGFGIAADSSSVSGCFITNFGHSGIGGGFQSGTGPALGIQNIVVERNVITAGSSNYCRGLAFGEPTRVAHVVVRRNYVYDQNINSQFTGQSSYIYSNIFDGTPTKEVVPWAANSMASYSGVVGADTAASLNLVFANNTFTNANAILRIAVTNLLGPMGGDVFANNLCTDWRLSQIGEGDPTLFNTAILSDSTYAAPWSFKNNAFWKSTGDDIVLSVGRDGGTRDSYNVNMLNARAGCSGNLYGNPLFVGGTGRSPDNFRLSSSSPYLSSGVPLASLLPPDLQGQAVDYYGNPFGPTPSLGAIQYPFVGVTGASIAAPTDTLDVGAPIHCTAAVTPANADIASYAWVVRVGGSVVQTGSGPSITFNSSSPSNYTFSLTVTDKLGYQRTATADVVVRELPRIEMYGPQSVVASGATVAFDVTVFTFHASDVSATRNGAPYTWPANGTFTQEGAYVITASGVTTVRASFTIDKTAPVVTGVSNGVFYNTNRTITFNEGTATLNGAAFTSGSVVSAEGAYTLVVTDLAANATTVGFTIDKTAPVVTGVSSGVSYNTNRTITFNEGTATLNGAAFTSGSVVSAEGNYTLVVTDAAGNATTVSFTIDKTAPVVTGVVNGVCYNTNRTITFNEGTATLNGAAFTSGSVVSAEGNYTLVVTDAAGNATTVAFTIDKTAPVISGRNASGQNVPDFGRSSTAVTVTVTELNEATRSCTKNGQPFAWPTNNVFTQKGDYVCTVVDRASNSGVYHFTKTGNN